MPIGPVNIAAKKAAEAAKPAEKAAKLAVAAANKATAKLDKAAASSVAAKVTLFLAIFSLVDEAEKRADEARIASRLVKHIVDEAAKAGSARGHLTALSKARKAVENAEKCVKQAEAAVDQARIAKDEADRHSTAAVLAELVLSVNKFLERHKKDIYDNLEKCDTIALKARANGDMIFIVESLPIINGIIHIGATREKLNKAIEWVRTNLGETTNSLNVLSTLVFRYVVDKGIEGFRDSADPDKQEIWKRIEERLKRQL